MYKNLCCSDICCSATWFVRNMNIKWHLLPLTYIISGIGYTGDKFPQVVREDLMSSGEAEGWWPSFIRSWEKEREVKGPEAGGSFEDWNRKETLIGERRHFWMSWRWRGRDGPPPPSPTSTVVNSKMEQESRQCPNLGWQHLTREGIPWHSPTFLAKPE